MPIDSARENAHQGALANCSAHSELTDSTVIELSTRDGQLFLDGSRTKQDSLAS